MRRMKTCHSDSIWRGNAPRRLELYESPSLGLFLPEHPVRRATYRVVDDRRFDYVIIALICVSAVLMAYEHPHMTDATTQVFFILDVVFTVVFTVEMLLKIVAFGLYQASDSYLRDPWNVMDGSIVVLGLVSLFLASASFGWVRSLRTLKVLRPLRVINRVPELRVVVAAIFKSVPELANVALVSAVIWLIFGILGMQLFLGKFVRCSDPTVTTKAACVGEVASSQLRLREWVMISPPLEGGGGGDGGGTEAAAGGAGGAGAGGGEVWGCSDPAVTERGACVGPYDELRWSPREWIKEPMNFDNIGVTMRTLFEMCTTEGWVYVMHNGVDAVSPTEAMQRDAQPIAALYFITFMMVGHLFVVNLFVGIILDNFTRQADSGGDDTGALALMTDEQRGWVREHRKINFMRARVSYEPPSQPWRAVVHSVATSSLMEYAMLLCIVINAVFMGLEHYNMSDALVRVLKDANLILTVVFTLEAVIKLVRAGVTPRAQLARRVPAKHVVESPAHAGVADARAPEGGGAGGGPNPDPKPNPHPESQPYPRLRNPNPNPNHYPNHSPNPNPNPDPGPACRWGWA